MTEIPNDHTRSDGIRKRGAQPKNTNRNRHCLKAGQLPKDAKYIEHRMNAFRREIEAAVLADRASITLASAAYIQTAMRWERHAALAQRWLTKAHDEMTPEQRLHFSREIAKASAERDKAISALKLDSTENKLPWLTTTATPAETDE